MFEMILLFALSGGEGRFFERHDVDFWRTRRRPGPVEYLWPDSTAPAPARRLLEDPTPENARAYLAWQEERFRRLRAASAALDGVSRKPSAPILYFSRPDCPFCERQEEELRGLQVTRVPPDSPLWKEHSVTVTPTLIVNGKVFRGWTPRRALLEEGKHE